MNVTADIAYSKSSSTYKATVLAKEMDFVQGIRTHSTFNHITTSVMFRLSVSKPYYTCHALHVEQMHSHLT